MKYMQVFVFLLVWFLYALPVKAVTSNCEECHAELTPGITEDFNRGVMSKELDCTACHGEGHMSPNDVEKALLPSISTCQECHENKVEQYLSGKHVKGLLPITSFPGFAHKQPTAYISGQKGCNGCHNQGIIDEESRNKGLAGEFRTHFKYGMDCQNCHTRHIFSKFEAKQPEACMQCHTGFDHAQWEMWTRSKHGAAYMTNRDLHRGPTCQDCHMSDGNHKVITAWGFLAIRLPEKDSEWMSYRISILKALGILDKKGKPTVRLDIVKTADMARLTKDEFDVERDLMVTTCKKCHTETYVTKSLGNSDQMIKAADQLFAEAIELVARLYQDKIIESTTNSFTFPYPDLLNFYEVDSHIEELLYEMFMDFRMKTYQASFHLMPDYTTWYGYSKMKETLVEMKELDKKLRRTISFSK